MPGTELDLMRCDSQEAEGNPWCCQRVSRTWPIRNRGHELCESLTLQLVASVVGAEGKADGTQTLTLGCLS